MKIMVHVEGGGNARELKKKCRRSFGEFFRKAGLEGRLPRIFAGGSRGKTYGAFRDALDRAGHNDFIVLLVDSEGVVAGGSGPWRHLRTRDGWDKPEDATDESAHLMVQCMESWFLADKDLLEAFFGDGFNRNALPGNRNIEEVPKDDVLDGLKNATRQCRPKGEYGKGRHSFELLSEIDPAKVMAASPHAKRLVDTLLAKAS